MAITDLTNTTWNMTPKEQFINQLNELSDAINEKAKTSGKMTISEMTEAVQSISSASELEATITGLIEGNLTEIVNENATMVHDNAFASGTYWKTLKFVHFKNAKTIGNNAFNNCRTLKKIQLDSVTSIGTNAFYLTSTLMALIIGTPTVCTLNSPIANGMINSGEGYIYVPRALIEDYKIATNWSTLANKFRALEDYTKDGTTTGEFDDEKAGIQL